ncbi:MAG TPA: hypothetical protein VGW80_06800 [Solirubrobacterales bacterium]|nr:hypothetical protein [Solirubrobacterales bacterium]
MLQYGAPASASYRLSSATLPPPADTLAHLETIDQQLLLVGSGETCQAMLVRPSRITEEEPEAPIVGTSVSLSKIIERLSPALEIGWPDHPAEPKDLEAFLEEASTRLFDAAAALKTSPNFVPAAGFARISRDLIFEHVKVELEDARGGIETEDLWRSFDALESTAPIKRLTRAGLTIKLRALGAFILFGRTWRDDEMTADDFFPEGDWKRARDAQVSEALEKELGLANKQVAHITLTRPLPEDIEVYAGSGLSEFNRIIALFAEFERAVDSRLLPPWWSDWFISFSEGPGRSPE